MSENKTIDYATWAAKVDAGEPVPSGLRLEDGRTYEDRYIFESLVKLRQKQLVTRGTMYDANVRD